MTNREKYVNEILDIAGKGKVLAVDKSTGKPIECDSLSRCENCLFYDKENRKCGNRKWWLDSEYVDWTKVAVDTPILVSDDPEFKIVRKGHFAQYTYGVIYTFSEGMTSWTATWRTHQITGWNYAKLATESDLRGE